MDCIFCKIVNKEIPSFVLHEDDDFLVILDKFPQTKGHALIISKTHAQDIFSLDGRLLERTLKLAVDVATKLKKVVNYEGVNIIQNNGKAAGQTVFHFHLHIIPRFTGDGVLAVSSGKEAANDELGAIRDMFCSL